METIRKTVESKYAPKQTNVIWVDTSGDTPVEKHFIKGKWQVVGGGGGGNSDYTITKSYVTLDEETLTTNPGEGFIVGFQNDFQLIYGDTYIVTYNGVKYKCVADKDYECIWIGGHDRDFSEYPFQIAYYFDEEDTLLFAETQGTYTVKIEHLEESVETTHDFEIAGKSVVKEDSIGLKYFDFTKYFSVTYGASSIGEALKDGYSVVNSGRKAPYFIVKVTGNNPSVQIQLGEYLFTDCEPVIIEGYDYDNPFTPIMTYKYTPSPGSGEDMFEPFIGFSGVPNFDQLRPAEEYSYILPKTENKYLCYQFVVYS